MYLILGLGNPGLRYEGTRHNVGFAVVDELAARHGFPSPRSRCRAQIRPGRIGDRNVLLAKPMTYMNLSGEAAACLASYYRVDAARIWVVLDDAALPLGTLRMRLRGSSGGHNGLASVEERLGTQEFPRVRIGIGRADSSDLVDHVLSRFRQEELPLVHAAVARAADAIEYALEEGMEAAMSRFNGPAVQLERGVEE